MKHSSTSRLGSLLKIAQSGANQRAASLVTDLMGPAGLVDVEYDAALATGEDGEVPPQMLVIRSRANSIEGGSDEIQRNVIGEQVLGSRVTSASTRTCPGATCRDPQHPRRSVARPPAAQPRPNGAASSQKSRSQAWWWRVGLYAGF